MAGGFYDEDGYGCQYPSVVLGIFLVLFCGVAYIKFGTQSTTMTSVHNYAYVMMGVFAILAGVGGYGVAKCPKVEKGGS